MPSPSRDVVARYAALGGTIVYQLLLTPVLIRSWGTAGFDLWISSLSSAQLLVFMDLGTESLVSNEASRIRLTGTTEDYQRYIWKVFGLYGLYSGAVVVLCGAAYAALSLTQALAWWYVDPFIFLMVGLMTAAQMPLCVYSAIYRSQGEYGTAVLVKAATDLLMYATLATCAASGVAQGTSVAAMVAVAVVAG